MPSPFPGMNPCLEHPDPCHDFHQTLIQAPPISAEDAAWVSTILAKGMIAATA